MPTVHDILAEKGPHVHSTPPDATVLDAINKMNQHKIGALVVKSGEQVVGMFTERDVLRRVIGERRDPTQTTVMEVMTSEIVCIGPHADLDEVSSVMKSRRIRHVPVCDEEGHLLGMVSIGDVNAWHTSNQQATIHYLNEYIYGRV